MQCKLLLVMFLGGVLIGCSTSSSTTLKLNDPDVFSLQKRRVIYRNLTQEYEKAQLEVAALLAAPSMAGGEGTPFPYLRERPVQPALTRQAPAETARAEIPTEIPTDTPKPAVVATASQKTPPGANTPLETQSKPSKVVKPPAHYNVRVYAGSLKANLDRIVTDFDYTLGQWRFGTAQQEYDWEIPKAYSYRVDRDLERVLHSVSRLYHLQPRINTLDKTVDFEAASAAGGIQ